MMSAALAYAGRLGWAVFPVAADCRTPIRGEGFEHGVLDATSDLTEIERRWTLHPSANVALACGERSGILALDVDVKGADGFASLAELEDENGWLPETCQTRTPSGGAHLLFRHPAGRALRNRVGFRPGLDIRTDRGSIALPPSRRPDGRYRWAVPLTSTPPATAPDWLMKILDPPEPPRAPRPPLDLKSQEKAVHYIEAALDGECRAIATMGPNTGRNQRLFQASANLGELVGANLLPQHIAEHALETASAECGLLKEDGLHAIRATIASGMRKGMASPREVRLEQR